MKKRTRYRLRNDLAAAFVVAILLCLLGAAASAALFFLSFFRALDRLGEEPIAEITFKYRTAERKFIDRVVWDRLRQNSPVYNGDTIHTAEASEATVWFPDGSSLELSEDTMAQVFRRGEDGRAAADVSRGIATAAAAAGGGGLLLSSRGVSVNVGAGSVVSASAPTSEAGGSGSSFVVRSGSAGLSGGGSISAGESVGGSGEVSRVLSVLSPLPSETLLGFGDGEREVGFSWNEAGRGRRLRLTVASDRRFSRALRSVEVGSADGVSVNLPRGTWWWRLEDADDPSSSCSGRLRIVQSPAPEPVVPVDGYEFRYRTRPPAVRFIWTEAEAASHYRVEVSGDEDFRTVALEKTTESPSLIISSLGEGRWWWRVTPYYPVNGAGFANTSRSGSFVISRSGELYAPPLVVPIDGDFVDKTSDRGVTFSWRMDGEASGYRLRVSKNGDLSRPILERECAENYAVLPADIASTLEDGQYYWGVVLFDSEGNLSPRSDVRSFYAISGSVEQRTVFPPDGYEVWSPLLADLRFTWRTNVRLPLKIQAARDEAFSDVAFEGEAANGAFTGVSLGEGTWWWRIVAGDGQLFSATPGKRLVVVGESAAPRIVDPTEARRAIIRPGETYPFRWSAGGVAADWWRVRIHAADGRTLVDENFVTGGEFRVDMNGWDEGSYTWDVQGFSQETARTSRRTSRLSSSPFVLRKISPAELVSPADGAVIDGLTALDEPQTLVWSSAEPFSSAVLSLVRVGGAKREMRQTGFRQRLGPLFAGTYEWRVSARTMDDIDISSERPSRFTVLPIPPFDASEKIEAVGGPVFGAKHFRKRRAIEFRWKAVPRASAYIVEVFDQQARRIASATLRGADSTSWTLDDLSLLSRGDFSWTVRGVRLDGTKAGGVLIDGVPAAAKFSIDFAVSPGGGKRRDTGDIYGRD